MQQHEQGAHLFLLEIFKKDFRDKKTNEKITYYEIWLSDRDQQMIYRIKPYDTQSFDPIAEKAISLLGQPVEIVTKTKLNKEQTPVNTLVDILPFVQKPPVM